MTTRTRCAAVLSLILLLLPALRPAAAADQDASANWGQWRGPEANGLSPSGDPPVKWDENTNVKWKVAVPGRSSATPIVWGNKLFIVSAVKTERAGPKSTTAAAPANTPAPRPKMGSGGDRRGGGRGGPGGMRGGSRGGSKGGRGSGGGFFGGSAKPTNYHRYVVMCIDRETGKTLWDRDAVEQVPHEGGHKTNTLSSGSPTTDGKFLYVTFGSRGIFCYDLEGNKIWERDLGDMQSRAGFGEGASPTLHGDSLIVPWDHEGSSKIYVLDTKNGETKWEADRDERTGWSTPLATVFNGRTQVIVNATERVRSYDLADGKLVWECGGQTDNPVPSPVRMGDVVYCMSGYRGNAALAMPLNASGDITDSDKILWRLSRGTPYVPSPLLCEGLLYFMQGNSAILSIVDAKTGEVKLDRERLPEMGTIYASPVGAAGRVYIVGRDGKALVIKNGPKFEVLSTNKLDDTIDASPVIVGKQMFLRGWNNLYCIAEGE